MGRILGALTFALGAKYQAMSVLQAKSWAVHDIPMSVVVDDRDIIDELLYADVNIIRMRHKLSMPFEFERYAYELSPYEVTIKTDSDVIIPKGWVGLPEWTYSTPVASGMPMSLQGLMIPTSPYRTRWSALGLPEVHSAFFTFNRDGLARDFFLEVGRQFDAFYVTQTSSLDRAPSTDLIYSLAWARVIGLDLTATHPFIHMKSGLTGTWLPDNWVKTAHQMLDNGGLYINGVQVLYPLHYFDKTFVHSNGITSRAVQGFRET